MNIRERGEPRTVEFQREGRAVVRVAETGWLVTHAEADNAIAAMRAVPPRMVEIADACGTYETRTVRVVPTVVVKARGRIGSIRTATNEVWVRATPDAFDVDNIRDAARAYADDAEVEIVSIDGGPDTVRRVS